MQSFKVGDRVQLSAFGKKNCWWECRTDKSGTVIKIEDDGLLMRDGSVKPIITYLVQFDGQSWEGTATHTPRNWQRKYLKKSKA